MFKEKGQPVSLKKNQLEALLKKLLEINKAKIITSLHKGNKEYSIAFSWDDKKAIIYLVVQ